MEQSLLFTIPLSDKSKRERTMYLSAFCQPAFPILDGFFIPCLGAPQAGRVVEPFLDGIDRIEHAYKRNFFLPSQHLD
jgi:hypothetical protein